MARPNGAHCEVHIRFKQAVVLIGLACLLFEHYSSQLFLWPLDHSCAPSANLSAYSSSFTDVHKQPINLEAIQRNLIDATPEDAFTLARASSMGIVYDDIARCYEYPLDFNSNQSAPINMMILEPCRFGMHFETGEPSLSLVEHFELVCSRRWLQALVPQALAMGLLLGCLASYQAGRGGGGQAPSRVLSRFSFGLLMLWLVVFVATKRLHDVHNESIKRLNIMATTFSIDGDYLRLLVCILLRSTAVSAILCRVLVAWRAQTPLGHSHHEENHNYFKTFALMVVVTKALFMPIVLRLTTDWTVLNRILTYNMSLLVSLALLIELAHSPDELARLRKLIRKASGTSQKSAPNNGQPAKRNDASRWQPVELCYNSDDDLDADQDEMLGGADGLRLGQFDVLAAERAPGRRAALRACEFCSAGNDFSAPHVVSVAQRAQDSMMTNRDLLTIETTTAAGAPLDWSTECANGDTYQPTTMAPIVGRPSREPPPLHAAAPAELISGATTNNDGVGGWLAPGGNRRAQRPARHFETGGQRLRVAHAASLVELNLFRWPVMRRLLLLTFCLAFNYFLLQTMPDHRLLHSESIASLARRKHDHGEWLEQHGKGLLVFDGTIVDGHHGASGIGSLGPMYTSDAAPAIGTSAIVAVAVAGAPHASGTSLELASLPTASHRPRRNSIDSLQRAKEAPSTTPAATMKATTPAAAATTTKTAAAEAASRPPTTQMAAARSASLAPAAPSSDKNNATPMTNQHGPPPPRGDDERVESGRANEPAAAPAAQRHQAPTVASSPAVARHVYESSQASPPAGFDYRSMDYATKTLNALHESNNPLEILWLTLELNGWPIELAAILLHSARLTDFQVNSFKLNRLFALAKHGSMALVAEWLLVALIRAKNHLVELEWLLALVLTLGRLVTTLMLYGHLHMLFRLAQRLQSNQLFRFHHHLPAVLVALTLASAAPLAERLDLIIIPISILLTNLLAHYLALKLDFQFRATLCPMLFE